MEGDDEDWENKQASLGESTEVKLNVPVSV